jgi:hypothetical protein
MASVAENFRHRCGASELNPAASIGSTGISQRFLTIQGIQFLTQRRKDTKAQSR